MNKTEARIKILMSLMYPTRQDMREIIYLQEEIIKSMRCCGNCDRDNKYSIKCMNCSHNKHTDWAGVSKKFDNWKLRSVKEVNVI